MSFPLAGNERLRDTLASALENGRLPHALLLEGDAGLGKRTLARFIARAALCEETPRPCGSCRSCVLFDAGTHPDFTAVSPESGKKSVTVDRIRELRRQVFIKPHISARRVFLLEDCGAMNEQSQNALLKILEEPPAGVVFLLTAESRTALLETIVSRCVTLTLSAPTRAQALPVLTRLLADNGLSDADGAGALDETGNNIGAALALLTAGSDGAAQAARRFLELLFEGSRTEQLRLLHPFCRDRVSADRLLAALRRETAAALRAARRDTARARALNRLYGQLCDYGELLKTNINLPLLFTALVCRAEK